MVLGDFATLPPEVISGQIYAGPGAGSLLTAATAWDGLAGELHSTAASYASAISGLISGSWQGPSSASFASAAAPYVSWLSTTATQAEEAASQARNAAGAYEATLASVVPPPVIAANRSLLAALVSTNIFGQNNSAIAATEAQYSQIWAQDVAALQSYASSAAAATQLTPFTAAPTTTNGTGEVAQSAAATSAAAAPTTLTIQQIEADITAITTAYTQFFRDGISTLTGGTQPAALYEAVYSTASGIGSQATYTNVVNSTISLGISQFKNFFVYQPWSAGIPLGSLSGGLASPGHVAAAAAAPVRAASAALGGAQTVGALSVPPNWASATPAIKLASTSLPMASAAAAPAATMPFSLLNQGTLGSLTGGALGSPAARVVNSAGVKARVTTGTRREAPVKLDRVIAQLQEQPDKVQHWSVDEAGLDDLVAKLSTKPGIHAVHVSNDREPAVTRPDSLLG